MQYYQALAEYLASTGDEHQPLRDALAFADGDTAARVLLARDSSIANTIRPKTLARYRIAQELQEPKQRETALAHGASSALLDYNFAQTQKLFRSEVQSLRPQLLLRDALEAGGYDVEALDAHAPVLMEELRIAQANTSYHVPIREFYGPYSAQSTPTEYPAPAYRLHDWTSFSAGATLQGLEYLVAGAALIAASPFLLVGMAASAAAEAGASAVSQIRKRAPDGQYNFNKKSRREKQEERTPEEIPYAEDAFATTTYDGFHASYLVQGMPARTADQAAIDAAGHGKSLANLIRLKKSRKTSSRVTYEYIPNNPFLLIPVAHAPTKNQGNTEVFVPDAWSALDGLALEPLPLLRVPETYSAFKRSLAEEKGSLETVTDKFSREFQYAPTLNQTGLSRFEQAVHQRAGVCQDINYLLLDFLRQQNIPSHLLLGYQSHEGKLTHQGCHAIVIAKEQGKWVPLDATPARHELPPSALRAASPAAAAKSRRTAFTNNIRSVRQNIAGRAMLYRHATSIAELTESIHAFYAAVYVQDDAAEGVQRALRAAEKRVLSERPKIPNADYLHPLSNGTWEVSFEPKGTVSADDIAQATKYFQGFAATWPDYARRIHDVAPPEAVNRIREAGRRLHPFSDNPDAWHTITDNLIMFAGAYDEPPWPTEVENPKLTALLHRNAKGAVSTTILPLEYQVRDRMTPIFRGVRLLPSHRGNPEHGDFTGFMEKFESLWPRPEHYVLSQDVIDFDNGEGSESYWNKVADIVEDTTGRELGAGILIPQILTRIADLKQAKENDDFDLDFDP